MVIIVAILVVIMLLWYYFQPYHPIYVITSDPYDGPEPTRSTPHYNTNYYNAFIHHPIDYPLAPYLALGEYRPSIIIVDETGSPLVTLTTVPLSSSTSTSTSLVRSTSTSTSTPLVRFATSSASLPHITDDYAIIPLQCHQYPWMKRTYYPRVNCYWGRPLIPSRIHQSSPTLVVSLAIKIRAKGWRVAHPTAIYHYHSHYESGNFLRRSFTPPVTTVTPFTIALGYLLHRGGLAVDVTIQCLRTLDPLLATHDLVVMVNSSSHTLDSRLLAAIPHHSFLRSLLAFSSAPLRSPSSAPLRSPSSAPLRSPSSASLPPPLRSVSQEYLGLTPTAGSFIHSDGTRYYVLLVVDDFIVDDAGHRYGKIIPPDK